jgi:hypothetical protein
MILYCTSHEIALHQTSVLMWNNENMKNMRPMKFFTSAEYIGAENLNAVPTNK